MANEQAKRPHLYELDPLRSCTALSVIVVHVLAFTAYLNATGLGYDIQNAVLVAFHFTREVFLFVTAFALVYVYNGRQVSPWQFWKKRAVGVVLPYVFWSLIYVCVDTHITSPGAFLQTSVFDILTGNASYQLYYILLTMQFYLFFPLFLPCIRFCARYPWKTLTVSFVVQVVFFYVDFHTIQNSTLPFWQAVTYYQDRFLPVYQFYFILGGLTACYFTQVRAFVLRHGRLILSVFVLMLAGLCLHYALQLGVFHETVGYATSVLQPEMVFYSIALIFCAFWLVCRWASKLDMRQHPGSVRLWHTLSNASFGIYLIHVLILNSILLRWMVPALPTVWPVALRVFLTWFVTAGATVIICLLLLRMPILSRLVGRSGPPRKKRTQTGRPVQVRLPDPAVEQQEMGIPPTPERTTQHILS